MAVPSKFFLNLQAFPSPNAHAKHFVQIQDIVLGEGTTGLSSRDKTVGTILSVRLRLQLRSSSVGERGGWLTGFACAWHYLPSARVHNRPADVNTLSRMEISPKGRPTVPLLG